MNETTEDKTVNELKLYAFMILLIWLLMTTAKSKKTECLE